MLSRITFPTKVINNTALLINSIVYDTNDFFQAAGYGEVEGPLSISLAVINASYSSIYIGLRIRLNNQIIVVADRVHIAFVAPFETKTISAASIPQLAYIDGHIDQITVIVQTVGLIVQPITINLVIDKPAVISAPQPIIGKDTMVSFPGQIQALNQQVLAIAPGIGNTLVSLAGNAEIRRYLHQFSVVLFPTIWPGDIVIRVTVSGIAIYVIHSAMDDTIGDSISLQMFTPYNAPVAIMGDNYNSNQSGHTTFTLLYEPIP